MCRLYSTVQLVEQNENKTLEKTHMYVCMFCGGRGTRAEVCQDGAWANSKKRVFLGKGV